MTTLNYFFKFFLVKLSTEALIMGTIVSTAFNSHDKLALTKVILIQVIASLIALGLNQTSSEKIHSKFIIIITAFFGLSISIFSNVNTISWFLGILLRQVTGILLLSKLNSDAQKISQQTNNSILFITKKLQIISIISTILGWGIGPVLSASLALQNLLVLDLFLLIITFILDFKSVQILTLNQTGQENTLQIDNSDYLTHFAKIFLSDNKFWILNFTVIFITFTFAGILHVVEVPLLISKFNASANLISILFMITALSLYFGVWIVKENLLNKVKIGKLNLLSSLCIVILSSGYLFLDKIYQVFLLLIIFGTFNGIMNLSQTLLMNSINSYHAKKNLFVFYSFITNIGIFTGVCIASTVNITLLKNTLILVSIIYAFLIITLTFFKLNKIWTKLFLSLFLINFVNYESRASSHVLKIPVYSIPTNYSPIESYDIASSLIFGQVYDNLYYYDNLNRLIPKIAENHSLSSDGLILKIKIKPNIYFTDNTKLSAQDVVDSWSKSIRLLGENSRWAFGDVVGFDSFVKDKSQKNLKGLYAINDNELEIRLSIQNGLILQSLTARNFSIFKVNSKGEYFGTGKFYIKSLNNNKIELKRKKSSDAKYYDEIHFYLNKSESEAVKNAIKYDYDLIQLTSSQSLPNKNYNILNFRTLKSMVLMLNSNSSELKNKKTRCNVIKNINTIIKNSKVNWMPLSKGLSFSNDLFSAFDNLTNKNIALIKPNFKFSPIEINIADSSVGFKESLLNRFNDYSNQNNLAIRFKKKEIAQIIQESRTGKLTGILFGFAPDYLELDAFLSPLVVTNQQYNFFKYSNNQVDQLISLSRQMVNEFDRNTVIKKALEILTEDCSISLVV